MNPQWKIPPYKIYTDDEDLVLITKIVKRGQDWHLMKYWKKILKSKNFICIIKNNSKNTI